MIPPENGGFLMNRAITKNVDCPYYDSGDNIDKVFSGVPSEYFESDTLVQALCINMSFSEIYRYYGFAIVNHNIPEEYVTSIKVKWSSTGFVNFDAEDTLTWHERNIYKFIDRQYKYCQVEIVCGGFKIRIGELFPAREKFQFPHNYHWGYDQEFSVVKDVFTSDSGTHFEEPNVEQEDDPPAEFEKFSISFGPADRGNWEQYKNLVRVGQKIFIPDFTQPVCHMGIIPDSRLKGKRKLEGDDYSLSFLEHSIVPS